MAKLLILEKTDMEKLCLNCIFKDGSKIRLEDILNDERILKELSFHTYTPIYVKMFYKDIQNILQLIRLAKEKEAERWHPVEEGNIPDDEYIMLNFQNFYLPAIGRYEKGAFYIGDEEKTCIERNLFVDAWSKLPKRFNKKAACPNR